VDVDERRRAQDARAQQDQHQLELARQFESWILAIVGHDIRNPLGAINSSASLLALRAGRDEKLHDIADRIARSAGRITNIVGDLLDLSRERHGGGIPIALSETDLDLLCREVAAEVATFATGRTIEVECAGALKGQWDPNRLMQALSNLLGNAVQHGAPGTPIDVRVRSDDGNAVIEVHNDGAIPSELMASLFEPFSAREGRRHRDGLGLGLFIAKSIARAHRGDLVVDSSPERGTTFRLLLPRAA
jgi:signal transduction histidine kinase